MAKEAADYLNAQIDGESVSFGGSMTLSQMGLFESLGKHNKIFSHWNVPDGMNAAEVLKNASTCDNYLLSANGLAETGEIINIDGTGNRVSSSLYGHKRVWPKQKMFRAVLPRILFSSLPSRWRRKRRTI